MAELCCSHGTVYFSVHVVNRRDWFYFRTGDTVDLYPHFSLVQIQKRKQKVDIVVFL